MSEELEKSLRAALRPVDPGAAFTQRVMAQVAARKSERRLPWATISHWRWLSGAAAAAVAAVVLVHVQQERHTREGLQARAALMQALQVTGHSLALANRVVNDRAAARDGV